MLRIKSFLLATLTLVALLIPASAEQMSLSGTLKDVNDGSSYSVTISPVVTTLPPVVAEPAPVVAEPPPAVEPPVASGAIPLTYTDGRFSKNSVASSTTVASGGTISNKSITDTGQTASIVTRGPATIDNVRIKSREGVRVGGGGTVTIQNSYIEVNGAGDDHADGLQAYSPGSKGVITVRNSTFKTGTTAVNAGFFIADNWTGTIDFDNVVIWGGPYGLKIHPDVGGDNIIRFKNVYVVGPFTWGGLWVDERTIGGHKNIIQQWGNVREATIKDGKLVPGNLIPKPF